MRGKAVIGMTGEYVGEGKRAERGATFDAKLRDWSIRLRLILCHVPLPPSLSGSTRTLSNIVRYLRSDVWHADSAQEITATNIKIHPSTK